MKKILTNYLFKFLFNKGDDWKDGDLLECQGDLFIFDSSNGNPNSMKWYFRINGFWNYIKTKKGSIYSTDKKRFLTSDDVHSQGYRGLEYYKNLIYKANEKNIKLYERYKSTNKKRN